MCVCLANYTSLLLVVTWWASSSVQWLSDVHVRYLGLLSSCLDNYTIIIVIVVTWWTWVSDMPCEIFGSTVLTCIDS